MPNKNLRWRPNDNGSLTNLRYGLEAEKWLRAVKSADAKLKRPTAMSIKGDLRVVGMFFQIPLLLLLFIFLIPLQLIKVIFRYNIKVFPGDPPTGKILTDRENFDARISQIRRESRARENKKPTVPPGMTEEEIMDLITHIKAETKKAY